MSFLDRVFRRRARSTRDLRGTARVELECEVAPSEPVVSPVTGARAALIRWTLLEQQTFHYGGKGGRSTSRYRALARGLYGTPLILLVHDGETIEVPLERSSLVLVEDPDEGELLQRMPPEIVPVVREVRAQGPIAYREAHLRAGDRVRLTATLERLRGGGAGYRDAAEAGPALRAIPDERIVLHDRLA